MGWSELLGSTSKERLYEFRAQLPANQKPPHSSSSTSQNSQTLPLPTNNFTDFEASTETKVRELPQLTPIEIDDIFIACGCSPPRETDLNIEELLRSLELETDIDSNLANFLESAQEGQDSTILQSPLTDIELLKQPATNSQEAGLLFLRSQLKAQRKLLRRLPGHERLAPGSCLTIPENIVVKGVSFTKETWARAFLHSNKSDSKCYNVLFDSVFSDHDVETSTKSGRGMTKKLDEDKLTAISVAHKWLMRNRKNGVFPYSFTETADINPMVDVSDFPKDRAIHRRHDRKRLIIRKATKRDL